jgi:quinoprotein glucose dehydrogenase
MVQLMRTRVAALAVLFVIAGVVSYPILRAAENDTPQARKTSGWPSYGNDPGGMRYAALNGVNPGNVSSLKVAWEYRTGDKSNGKRSDSPSTSAFEATPILVDGRLIFCTPFNRVIALDPLLGRELWPAPFDPKIDRKVKYENQLACRGVSAWTDKAPRPGQKCVTRIFTGTNDGRLIALDAENGRKCDDFGQSGEIDLKREADVGRLRWKGEYQVTSPPAIAGNLVVVGSAIADNQRTDAPSGVVRAFDARSGELVWAQDLVPPTYTGPRSERGYALGSPNVWSIMSVDEALNLIYLPTGNPSPDFFGGQGRPPDDYGSSVVALYADTGKVAWSFQAVHHDLWDYDIPAQPALFTYYNEDGTTVPALAQATKTGHLFILNRQTGKPIAPTFDVIEKPVSQSGVAGERTSPTQPFPVRPGSLGLQALTIEDVKRPQCRRNMDIVRSEGIFTPPTLRGTVLLPGSGGGLNWSGVAIDPVRRMLITNSTNAPYQVRLFPAERYPDEKRADPTGEVRPQDGTPYGMTRSFFTEKLLFGLVEIPCNEPSWGYLNAVDLRTGQVPWRTELGRLGRFKGLPSLGGAVLTSTGLAFIAGTIQDDRIRAFSVEKGDLLWEHKLPAGGQATPMTYEVELTDGRKRQFVVIAAGGNGRATSKLGDSLVAFSLPEK